MSLIPNADPPRSGSLGDDRDPMLVWNDAVLLWKLECELQRLGPRDDAPSIVIDHEEEEARLVGPAVAIAAGIGALGMALIVLKHLPAY